MNSTTDDSRTARAIMDRALKRALNTPPTTHKSKPNGSDSKAASKPRRKAKREA